MISRSQEPIPAPLAILAANRHVDSIKHLGARKATIALVIAAYNEELVLEHTILSAIAAGLSAKHIYVVDDASTDATRAIAARLVGLTNILSVAPSGKGRAIAQINEQLRLTKRYRWIHIADADGEFDAHYFASLRRDLRVSNAAATGFVTSMPGGYIGQFRAFEYSIGMDVVRRFQNLAGMISIVPGPTSVFRSDVFEQLEFSADSLCEDFDVTLQIHRKRLGSIQFIPEAVARTQDPGTFGDYIKQITRWNRGVLQAMFKHKVGMSLKNKVDVYLPYQVMQNLLFFAMYFIWVPYVSLAIGSLAYAALVFLSDVIVVFGFAMFAAGRTGRRDILAAFPVIYAFRWINLLVFMKSFVEVVILRKYRHASGRWQTVTRRVQSETS